MDNYAFYLFSPFSRRSRARECETGFPVSRADQFHNQRPVFTMKGTVDVLLERCVYAPAALTDLLERMAPFLGIAGKLTYKRILLALRP